MLQFLFKLPNARINMAEAEEFDFATWAKDSGMKESFVDTLDSLDYNTLLVLRNITVDKVDKIKGTKGQRIALKVALRGLGSPRQGRKGPTPTPPRPHYKGRKETPRAPHREQRRLSPPTCNLALAPSGPTWINR